jgi:hypothetical protein
MRREMVEEPEMVDVSRHFQGVPSICADAALGASWFGESHRIMLADAMYNPTGGDALSAYRPCVNLILSTTAVRDLIAFLQKLPGVDESRA